ncbi:hypothetical protein HYPSUDRAFT_65596 [Hypholoma sublateritium FD-334 SS-4]|uniref:Uncharacterized protein n=1 Tax=Hypholoma sublateritium (strain FD-334 SS-4) TaxID=945553 RepID=A0A0D2P0B8_HYPSF|nr:hypothetical protein HYPSUDRAFT_65596 [Hypholoma sublateritium FD-334 SS-4]
MCGLGLLNYFRTEGCLDTRQFIFSESPYGGTRSLAEIKVRDTSVIQDCARTHHRLSPHRRFAAKKETAISERSSVIFGI